jgi:hypothetical protein
LYSAKTRKGKTAEEWDEPAAESFPIARLVIMRDLKMDMTLPSSFMLSLDALFSRA